MGNNKRELTTDGKKWIIEHCLPGTTDEELADEEIILINNQASKEALIQKLLRKKVLYEELIKILN